jgi:hypothetical protein
MFCTSAGIAIVPAAENAAVPAENTAAPAENAAAPAENAAVPAENAAVSLPRYMGGTMTAAEIAHAAVEESMDTSRRSFDIDLFDQWYIFLAGRVGMQAMNNLNAEPEMYNAHFEDFLVDQDRADLGILVERFATQRMAEIAANVIRHRGNRIYPIGTCMRMPRANSMMHAVQAVQRDPLPGQGHTCENSDCKKNPKG